MARSNDISREMRLAIFERDYRRCARCGRTIGLTLQHRKNKQMGGLGSKATALTWFDGITLCGTCNVLIESKGDLVIESILHGWKVPKNSMLPARLIPVYYRWEGQWQFLLADGQRSYVAAEIGAAICAEVYEWSS